MFPSTFTFWRRLVGKTVPTDADAQTDRRLWVRYPSDLQASVQPEGQGHRVSVRVRDISVGGANLLVDRPFDPGHMLILELPQEGTQDRHTVLACVVRAIPQGEGQWALGCSFSRALAQEDLECFGAQSARKAPAEQRAQARFATNLKSNYQRIGDADERTYPAQVINLSASGVGLEVAAAVDAGSLLSLDLIGTDGNVVRTILACVVHVTNPTNGVWALGCNFIRELAEEDLQALV